MVGEWLSDAVCVFLDLPPSPRILPLVMSSRVLTLRQHSPVLLAGVATAMYAWFAFYFFYFAR